jgi:drug/metabolite transporter (DMT)-like permease
MQPVFVAVFSAVFLHEHPTRTQWGGILVAVAGAFVIAWGDWGRGGEALLGDALALFGAVLVSVYYVIGRRLRQRLDLWTYTGVVYGVAALVLLTAALASGVELMHHPRREWALFGALALVPTLLGHTGANYALAHYRAYAVNLALLGEPVIASLLAWGLPGIREAPPLQTVLGGALILAGIGLGVMRSGASRHGDAPLVGT